MRAFLKQFVTCTCRKKPCEGNEADIAGILEYFSATLEEAVKAERERIALRLEEGADMLHAPGDIELFRFAAKIARSTREGNIW